VGKAFQVKVEMSVRPKSKDLIPHGGFPLLNFVPSDFEMEE